MNICRNFICLYIYTDTQASGVPSPPPNGVVWYGVAGERGGGLAGVCGEGWGPLELQLEKRPGVTAKASIVRKPYASAEAPAPAFINLNLNFKPYTQP